MMAAAVLARAGERDSARAVLARARRLEVDEDARTFLLYDEAHVLLLLGDRDQAIAVLRRYLVLRPFLRAYLSRDPVFRELHDDPRFRSATSPD
jgi:tetratricopeptide (TPR) repeat protein